MSGDTNPSEYELLHAHWDRYDLHTRWWHVRHRVNGTEHIWHPKCRKMSPYNPQEALQHCPHCEQYLLADVIPPPPTAEERQAQHDEMIQREMSRINPQTGKDGYGNSYKMVHDWDRGWVWMSDIGMK